MRLLSCQRGRASATVAQVFNRLYRGIAIRSLWNTWTCASQRASCRLQVGGTADSKSALRTFETRHVNPHGLQRFLAKLMARRAGTGRTTWGFAALFRVAATTTLLAGATVPAQPLIQAPLPKDPSQPDPLAAFMVPQPPIDTQSPIEVVGHFDPPRVAAGQPVVYRLTLTVLEQSVDWPDNIPFPDDWEVRRGEHAQFLQSFGAGILPRTTFLFHVTPTAPGRFTLPPFDMQARGESVTVPAQSLEVLPAGTPGLERPARLRIGTPEGDLYEGQSIPVEVLLPGRSNGSVQTLAQTQIAGEDILVDRTFAMQRVESRTNEGQLVPTFIYQALVTPLRPGPVELSAYGFMLGTQPGGLLIIRGNPATAPAQPLYTLVDSDPVTVNIRPLPETGRPESFNGAIGQFTLDPPVLSTNRLRTGDLLTLTLVMRGQGNLERVTPPAVPAAPEWQVLPPGREPVPPAVIRQRGFAVFEYRLVPMADSITATPRIPFSTFNPQTGRYEDSTIQPLTIEIEPGTAPPASLGQRTFTEARALLLGASRRDKPPERLGNDARAPGRAANELTPPHRRAGFLALQLLPTAILVGVWSWDRRRRFLEQHPQVLIRRRARRAIRRHARAARRAARRGDGAGFLSSGIAGLREACAPGKSAAPLALAGCDVLPDLPGEPEPVRQMAQQLFDAANTLRFGEREPATQELLALAPAVDATLERLRRNL